jgi:hypothetical protein
MGTLKKTFGKSTGTFKSITNSQKQSPDHSSFNFSTQGRKKRSSSVLDLDSPNVINDEEKKRRRRILKKLSSSPEIDTKKRLNSKGPKSPLPSIVKSKSIMANNAKKPKLLDVPQPKVRESNQSKKNSGKMTRRQKNQLFRQYKKTLSKEARL